MRVLDLIARFERLIALRNLFHCVLVLVSIVVVSIGVAVVVFIIIGAGTLACSQGAVELELDDEDEIPAIGSVAAADKCCPMECQEG